jgi:hypothetical protein
MKFLMRRLMQLMLLKTLLSSLQYFQELSCKENLIIELYQMFLIPTLEEMLEPMVEMPLPVW